MARGSHGLPKVSLEPAMPNPSPPCGLATSEMAFRLFQRWPAVIFCPHEHPTPYASEDGPPDYGASVHLQRLDAVAGNGVGERRGAVMVAVVDGDAAADCGVYAFDVAAGRRPVQHRLAADLAAEMQIAKMQIAKMQIGAVLGERKDTLSPLLLLAIHGVLQH
jgi:hypothetical protein